MPPAGFEPAIPVGDPPQTHALDRSATGMGSDVSLQLYVKAQMKILYCLNTLVAWLFLRLVTL